MPTSAVVEPAALRSVASGVHSARSCRSPRGGDLEQPLRADVLRVGRSERSSAGCRRLTVERLLGLGEDRVRLLPGQLVGRGDDRAERDPDPRARAPGRVGDRVDRRDLLGGLLQRLAPQPEDVALLAADPVGLGDEPPTEIGMVPVRRA